jgi:fructose-bisphosphate aldolase class II
MEDITKIVPPGVVTGTNLLKLFEHARDNNYAIPAVNCTRYVK